LLSFFVEPENKRFVELMETVGWTQAETARRLHMSSGGVNQIVKGTVRPSPQTLALLVRVVADEKPDVLAPAREGAAGSDPPELREKFDQLRDLHENDPAAFQVAAGVLDQFSSKIKDSALRAAKNAAAKVERDSPGPKRK
jgi:transcriptional regulator with XRE-family HTH domain